MRKRKPEIVNHIVDFCNEYQRLHGVSPSTREIAREVGVANGTAYEYLAFMRDNNIIEYDGKQVVTKQSSKVNHTNNNAPIVGRVVCGDATVQEADVKEYVDLPTAIFGDAESFILEAYGDSMDLAGVDEGDILVVKRQSDAKEGDLVVALIDGENNLKRIRFDSEHQEILLCPESSNPRYQVKRYKDIRIQGVVSHIIKAVKKK